MYLVINKSNNTIIHKNPHPDELTPTEVYANYDSNLHTTIFTEFYHESVHKIENGQLVSRTPKERTEFLIQNGELEISNTDKVDDDGQIVPKTNKEKYNDGILTEAEYRNILESNVKNSIYAHFTNTLEWGTTYNGKTFQCNEQSCNRINNAISKSEISGVVAPAWIASDDTQYPINDLQDLRNLGLAIGNYFEQCFYKRTQLRDAVSAKTILQLESYNIDIEWNNI